MDPFRALADPTRRLLLDVLVRRDDQTLFELTARVVTDHQVDLTRQAISHHLDVLERAGLVQTRREGRCKLHTIDPTPLCHLTDRWLHPDKKEAP